MWYTTNGMKKFIVTVGVVIMSIVAFVFGAGFGGAQGGGTLNVSDANRFVVFTSKQQLDEYATSHQGDFFNISESERSKYGDEFFATQALVMFLTDGMSGSIKVSCEGYKLQGNELHVTVKELSPPIHTMDLRYNTLTVAIPQECASKITKVVIDSYRVDI